MSYDIDRLAEEGEATLDVWAGFRQAIHEWGDGAAILCLLLLILKLLGDLTIISLAAAQGGVRAAMNAMSQVFLYHPTLYRKALARARLTHAKSRDFSVDWDAIPIGREAAEEMVSMQSADSGNDRPGRPGPHSGKPRGPSGGQAVAQTVNLVASAPAAANNNQNAPLLTGPAAAVPHANLTPAGAELRVQQKPASTFYPTLGAHQP